MLKMTRAIQVVIGDGLHIPTSPGQSDVPGCRWRRLRSKRVLSYPLFRFHFRSRSKLMTGSLILALELKVFHWFNGVSMSVERGRLLLGWHRVLARVGPGGSC